MKKFLVSLICMGLLTGSMVSAITPIRLAKCAFAPEKNNCTKEEKKTALGWFIGVPVAIVVAALALLGIKLTADQQQKIQQLQEQKKQEVAAAAQALPAFKESPVYESAKDAVSKIIEQGSQVNLAEEVGIF